MRALLMPLAMTIASPSLARAVPSGLPLPPGRALTITIDPSKTPLDVRIIALSAAMLDAYGEAMALRMAGVPCNKPACEAEVLHPGDLSISPPQPQANAVKFGLLRAPETGHTILVIENGYPQALTYRAQITHHGKTVPTDVCLVIPQGRGYEDWPYAIDEIVLSDFVLKPWTAANGIPCA